MKYTEGQIIAEAVAERKKSYHSKNVPKLDASVIRLKDCRLAPSDNKILVAALP